MESSNKPIANPVAVLREEFDDWAVLFNPDTADAVGVNPVGVAIWKLLDGRRSVEEIAVQVAEQFDEAPPTVADEVRAYVDELAGRGFVGYELKATATMSDIGGQPIPVMRTPRTVDIELTARCNLRCTYCYFFENPAVEYHDVPTEEWLRFFEECGRLGVMDLTLAGGEPFMRQDLKALLEGIVAQPHALRPALQRRADRRRYRLVHRQHPALQLRAGVARRFPAGDPRRLPGQGSWEGAVRGIRTLQRHSVPVAVRVTIHRHNVGDLENTAHFLLEELGLPGFGTNAAGYLGVCRGNAGDILLSTGQRQQAMEDPGPPDGEISRPHPGRRGPAGRGPHVARDGGGTGPGAPRFPGTAGI